MIDNDKNSRSLKMLLQVGADAKKKTGVFLPSIISDILACSRRYDMSYKEYRIYEFYKLNAVDRKKFMMMSDGLRIDKRYNQGINREVFLDKIKFATRFKDYTQRPVFDIRVNSKRAFAEFIGLPGKYVARQLEDNAGVLFFDVSEDVDVDVMLASLLDRKYYLVEPFIQQHPSLETLYPECVNTLRVTTFVTEDLQVEVLNVALKLGNGGLRDNFSRGGLFSVLDETGTVIRPFVNKYGGIYEQHPVTNENLVGFTVPFFDEAVALCKQAALEVPGIRYVGWDVAITEEGPRFVDGSLQPKFFQIPPSISAFVGETIQDLRTKYAEFIDLKRR